MFVLNTVREIVVVALTNLRFQYMGRSRYAMRYMPCVIKSQ